MSHIIHTPCQQKHLTQQHIDTHTEQEPMPHAMPSSALTIHPSHDIRPDTSSPAGPRTPTGSPLLAAGCPARVRACMRHAAAGLSTTGLSADSDRDTDSVLCRAQHSSKCAHSLLCMLSFTHAVLSTAATAPSFTHAVLSTAAFAPIFTHAVLSTAPSARYSFTACGDPCSLHAQDWVQSSSLRRR